MLLPATMLGMPDPEAQRSTSPVRLEQARSRVGAAIASSGAEAAVAWRPLDVAETSPDQLLLNASSSFHAASMMKVAVMIELFRQAAAGGLRLDDMMVVTNAFRSIVDGSEYVLSPCGDSETDVYRKLGQPMTLRALCDAMIIASSNLAANLLIEKLGPPGIQATMDSLGASGMRVLRGVEDQKAFDRHLNNATDASALLTLFWKLGRREIVSPAASSAMIGILERQQFNDAIPAALPRGTAVAHKTGTITRIHHDAGVVFAPRPYAVVVLVRGLEDEARSAALIAEITRIVDRLARLVDQ